MNKMTKKAVKKSTGLTNEGKRVDALTRIGNLETALVQLTQTLNKSFGQVKADIDEQSNNLSKYDMFLMGAIEILSSSIEEPKLLDKITAKVKENKIRQLEDEVNAQDAQLKIELAEGRLEAIETIKDDNNLIVSTQYDKDGTKLNPSRTFLMLNQFKPEVKEILLNKAAGETVVLKDGSSVQILGIYVPVPKKEEDSE